MASSAAAPGPAAHFGKGGGPGGLSVLRRGQARIRRGPSARRSTRNRWWSPTICSLRLNVHTGDTLRIGGQDFRIAGVVTAEPDRMTGSLNVGPRVMITREGLDRTGLIVRRQPRLGALSLLACRRTAVPASAKCACAAEAAFPEATIADYRETHPIITRGLDRATTFLSLIALIALVIGAMGVASAMHGHLQQKLDSIAVMKCMGARSAQIIRIYTAQTLMLGLGGGVHRRDVRRGRRRGVPRPDREIFHDGRRRVLGRVAGAAGHRRGVPGDAAVHSAAAAGHPRHPSGAGLPPRRGTAFATARRRLRTAGPRARFCSAPALIAGTLTEGDLRDSLRTGAYFTLALAIGIGLPGRRRMACAAAFCAAPARRAEAARRGPPRHRESLPAGQPGAGRGGRARRRRHVHADRFPGAERAGRADPRLRAARHAQRVSARYPGQPAPGAQRFIQSQPGVREAPDVAFAVGRAASPRSTACRRAARLGFRTAVSCAPAR